MSREDPLPGSIILLEVKETAVLLGRSRGSGAGKRSAAGTAAAADLLGRGGRLGWDGLGRGHSLASKLLLFTEEPCVKPTQCPTV